ncbi:MAG: formate--tetrahydrofolate ligase [Clostridiales bacterium]|nr:formate--tetrahydrofolate ligase [Clostridiales bacterium]
MQYLSDIEIAQSAQIRPISEIAAKLDIPEDALENYGKYKAKIDADRLPAREGGKGKLILVTAITPTAAGEGKTTTSVGLADGLSYIGKRAAAALREPSLGPVFGVKGGAAGGGRAQLLPMEDINLHFTGDFHAIGAANNLLAAMVDNHIQQGNRLNIDPRRICWRRAVDMNDRQLRSIISGLGGKANGVPREDGFDITVASEVMAVLCLADSLSDLKARLGRMVVGYTYDSRPVTCADIKADGAMTVLLKDAIKPNLVQTIEGTPAFVHGGPFANIAHGCSSVIATKLAMSVADYTVTEAGFGADLGAEKFLDIKCRAAGIKPNAVVIVATVRALKLHGGADKKQLADENMDAMVKGFPNLLRHYRNITGVYGLGAVVSVNRFPSDTRAELDTLRRLCAENGIKAVECECWAKGGEGAKTLAEEVVKLCEQDNAGFVFAYEANATVREKLNTLTTKIYGGDGVEFTADAQKQLREIRKLGYERMPVCVAKTQYSFSDDPALLGAPEHFKITVRSLKLSLGAGFIVALTGEIMTMPGLPKTPAAENIDIDETGRITGLF